MLAIAKACLAKHCKLQILLVTHIRDVGSTYYIIVHCSGIRKEERVIERYGASGTRVHSSIQSLLNLASFSDALSFQIDTSLFFCVCLIRQVSRAF
jgi:hypothetical protein